MVDGLTPILVSMAAILGIALVLVAVVAIRAQHQHEGTARARMRHRADLRRAHAAGKPVLFVDAARRQHHATHATHATHAGGRHEKAAS